MMQNINDLDKAYTEKLVAQIKALGLLEEKQQNTNQKTNESELWEYLVALFLHEQNYFPKRFNTKTNGKDNTNLDFGFKIQETEMYAECVCVSDGQSIGLSYESETEVVHHDTEAVTNEMALRLVSVISDKSKVQVRKFHEENSAKPTFLFVGQMIKGFPILSGDYEGITLLSECVQSLYGLTGGIFGYEVKPNSLKINKENKTVAVTRSGFFDGEFSNISAVIFSNKCPSLLLRDLYAIYDGSATALFAEYAEMIVNASPNEEVRLNYLPDQIFPKTRKIFCQDNKINLYHNKKGWQFFISK